MNMSEEEDCDDLPPITVNCSANNSSTFAMPPAEQLAEQRAHERERERQLELLRQRARADEQQPAAPRRSHSSGSSGSEGERALAAAVDALAVRAAPAAAHAPRAQALWAALLPQLPPHAAQLQWSAPAAQLARAVHALGAALAAPARGAWADAELLCAGAVLCVGALAHESRSRRAAARALHTLLDDCAAPAQVSLLTRALLAALPEARARLQLSDALRSGGDGGADRAAFALTAAAMLDLLGAPAQDGEETAAASLERVARAACAWRACDADTRYVCVQLTGRLLAATSDATDATDIATETTSNTSGATDAMSATRSATNATLATNVATEAMSNTSDATDATSTTRGATDGPLDTSSATDAKSTTSEAMDVTLATSVTPETTTKTSGAMDTTSTTSDATDTPLDTSGTTDTTSTTSDATDATLATGIAPEAMSNTSGTMDTTNGGATNATSTTRGATDVTLAMSVALEATSNTSSAMDATGTTASAADAPHAAQEARARLLAHLAPPPAGADDAQRPDRLKALVGASKLKLLFWAKNDVGKQPRAQRNTST